MSTTFKVAVCGGSGGIGQPLCMLLAQNPNVGEVSVIDVDKAMVPPAGVAADLSHMIDLDLATACDVKGYAVIVGPDAAKPVDQPQLREALEGCSLVLIPAGIPRKPGMTRDDLFGINAGIAGGLVEACAAFCPEAVLGMIVNPVNSVVPAMAKLYEQKGLDPMKVVGVTLLDVVRARKFMTVNGSLPKDYLASIGGANVTTLAAEATSQSCSGVMVIGGHAGKTILPLIGDAIKCASGAELSQADLEALDTRIQNAGTEVVEAKAGAGSATLSMAHAAACFARKVLAGLGGDASSASVCCAYVKSSVCEGLEYFASPVKFGPGGSVEVLPFDVTGAALTEFEKGRLAELVPQLQGEIAKGIEFFDAKYKA